jgi:CelD/BcsL family acetyltransferase involved in cellulose biosynthesis
MSEKTQVQVRVVPGRALPAELAARWDELQRGNPTLSSPYFRPELTQVAAAVREDVEVAVLEQQGVPQAFLPFQRAWALRNR